MLVGHGVVDHRIPGTNPAAEAIFQAADIAVAVGPEDGHADG